MRLEHIFIPNKNLTIFYVYFFFYSSIAVYRYSCHSSLSNHNDQSSKLKLTMT